MSEPYPYVELDEDPVPLRLTINGREYVRPEALETRRPEFGVAITTKDRWAVLEGTLVEFKKFTPASVPIFVIDDGSETQPDKWDDRFELVRLPKNRGIAGAKNKCLEVLYNTGVEHLFLFDDDAYPLVDEWWQPYVESPEPHLMRIFPDLSGARKLNDIRRVYGDSKHYAYTGPRGVMLYVERRVLDVVGGMDTIYGKWGWEHGDWSNRIHNAGLTTWRFADVAKSEHLIYSLDEHEKVDRGTVMAERREIAQRNIELYRDRFYSREYREFRDLHNVVLTCLYAAKDPQRPSAKPLTLAAVDPLLKSFEKYSSGYFVVCSNTGEGSPIVEPSPIGVGNIYVQRWYDYWRWLRAHPEAGFVWCVDGTDVEMLRNPFPEMRRGELYLGSEPKRVDDQWMQKNQSNHMRKLFREHHESDEVPLLNAGLVGGDRETVMSFIRAMLDLYEENQIDTFLRKDTDITENINDMGIFNVVGHSRRHITGVVVHTRFKANERNEVSWWKHK